MPTISLASFLTTLRAFSGLGSNDYLEDPDLIGFVNDAIRELDDQMVVVNRHWRSKTYEFTLTADQNHIDLYDLVPDYQATQGVDDLANPAKPRNVDRLGSFADRNTVTSKHYFEDGDRLYIYGRNPAGTYALHYTPQSLALALPVETEFAIGTSDNVVNQGGKLAFQLANINADATMVGGSLTLTFEAPNASWSGTYTIAEVLSSIFVVTTLDMPGGSFTNPAAGSATLNYQPVGTVDELPAQIHQWLLFIKLHASIAIREAQELETADFERKFAIQRQRINAMAHKRSDGLIQPPVSNPRRRFGFFGSSY